MSKEVSRVNELPTLGGNSFNIDRIPEYLELVKSKIKSLEEEIISEQHAKCESLEIDNNYKIGLKGREDLVTKLSQIIRKEYFYKKSAKTLGFKEPFLFKGLELSEIKTIFSKELKRNESYEEMLKLKEAKSELEKYLTDDHKAKALVNNIADILTK